METLLNELEKCGYRVATDTRKDLSGRVYFGIKGDTFDGNEFVSQALAKGAVFAVTDNPKHSGPNMCVVTDTLKTLQEIASTYRKKFNIPVMVIGGSNGKTTSKDLARDVLKTKYKVHATDGNFNNNIGVPLSLLSMDRDTEIGVFEIGANHPHEHTELLNIIQPTHVAVTNNGMDHLEGFGSPEGIRKANAEIYDWAQKYSATAFVNKDMEDLVEDSKKNICISYPKKYLETKKATLVTIVCNEKEFVTNLIGNYNLPNIEMALAVGDTFGIDTEIALTAICHYIPLSKRSQFLTKNNVNFIVDCYNANPTSMQLSLESFLESTAGKRGVVLGDMLELGDYSGDEHLKIVEYIFNQTLDEIILVGKEFKKTSEKLQPKTTYHWFPDSTSAQTWFATQKFEDFTFLLKGSRGIQVEKILG